MPPPWADPSSNPCAAQPRGWQLLYWPSDGKCYKIFQAGAAFLFAKPLGGLLIESTLESASCISFPFRFIQVENTEFLIGDLFDRLEHRVQKLWSLAQLRVAVGPLLNAGVHLEPLRVPEMHCVIGYTPGRPVQKDSSLHLLQRRLESPGTRKQ